MCQAKRGRAGAVVEQEFPEASKTPIIVIAVEHDGPAAEPLPKKVTNRGTGKKKKG